MCLNSALRWWCYGAVGYFESTGSARLHADVPMPDISTKEKAQEYIGLDMEKERKAKDKIVPEWLEKAKGNGRLAKL